MSNKNVRVRLTLEEARRALNALRYVDREAREANPAYAEGSHERDVNHTAQEQISAAIEETDPC